MSTPSTTFLAFALAAMSIEEWLRPTMNNKNKKKKKKKMTTMSKVK